MKSSTRKPIPAYMVDAINNYKATGRVCVVFPYAGMMSLNGFPRVTYDRAYAQMVDTLSHEVKP